MMVLTEVCRSVDVCVW